MAVQAARELIARDHARETPPTKETLYAIQTAITATRSLGKPKRNRKKEPCVRSKKQSRK